MRISSKTGGSRNQILKGRRRIQIRIQAAPSAAFIHLHHKLPEHAYTVLIPYFARDYLHGGPDTLGVLMASSGCGPSSGSPRLAEHDPV